MNHDHVKLCQLLTCQEFISLFQQIQLDIETRTRENAPSTKYFIKFCKRFLYLYINHFWVNIEGRTQARSGNWSQ